jgi:hypothetical protein
MNAPLKRKIAPPLLLCALVACSQDAAPLAAGNSERASQTIATGGASSDWISNGATACDKYLTPDLVDQIFPNPAGHAKKLGAQGCSFETPDFASINITLSAGGPSVFDAHQKYLTAPVPLSRVGDRAVRTATGIEAVKGADRMCGIDVMPPFGNKLKGDALAQKLGEVCNTLFALP